MKILRTALLGSLALASCAGMSWPTRIDSSAITNTPDHFLVVDSDTCKLTEPSGDACRNPLADPGDGTRLTLIRSIADYGDYQPDRPAYGLTGSQLQRIHCSDGRPVGAT